MPGTPVLDTDQQAVLALPVGASAVVLGAPGSGRTTTAVAFVADRIARGLLTPDQVLLLAPRRAQASRLRDRLLLAIGRPASAPLARTAASLAFDIARRDAAEDGRDTPVLLSGGDQDRLIGQLLPDSETVWPERLGPEVRETRAFRGELRELFARCTERDVDPVELADLGARLRRDEWRAAAEFWREYLEVLPAVEPDAFDSAELVAVATAAVLHDRPGDLAARLRLVVVDDMQDLGESAVGLLSALAGRGCAVVAFGDPDVAADSFRGGEPDLLGRFEQRLGIEAPARIVLRTVHRHPESVRRFVSKVTDRIGTALAGPQRAATARPGGAPVLSVEADSFRGGEPDLLGRFEQRLGIEAPARIVLRTVHRHPESVRRFVSKVTDRIGTALAGPQRAATARPGGAPVLSVEADGPGALAARIAHLLRERHLEHDVPFADQAVVVRSNSLVEPLARALEIAGVPAVTSGSSLDTGERAPKALVEVVAVALGLLPLTAESAASLVTGPFCGLDRLALRRLRLALRVEELEGGGVRSAGELLVEALAAPARLATIDTPFVRRAARLAQTMQQVRDLDAQGASAEDLLWHVWDTSGLAPVWRERALGAGLVAAEANRDLDDVVTLFASAARAAERGPTDPAAGFLAARLEADVADDSLAPRGLRDGVLVTTPVGVAGLEFDTVVIAGLQDGVWPNLRPRGSLLGLGELVAELDGRDAPASAVDERRAVLSDELRLFALAASRARSVLLLAAIANDDEAPSVLMNLADGPAPDGTATAPNALRPLVGHLRRTAVTGTGDERAEAAAALARLARADVPGAAPAGWWGLAPASTEEPLVPDPEQPVRVSPSKLERFEESPLDWFLERVAGGEPMLAGAIGTMLHWVLETAESPDEAALLAALEGRWRELDFEAEWVEAREHRLADRMIGGISRYLADLEREGAVLVGGETAFEFPAGRALATGTIDRVERDRDGRLRVIDLKTGSTRPSAAETATHAQLGVYQLAVRAGVVPGVDRDAPTSGAALLYVRQTTRDPYALLSQQPLDDEAAEGFRDRLAAAAEGMAAAGFDGPVEPVVRFGSSPFRPMLLRVPEVCGG